jgi:hypothetical protein
MVIITGTALSKHTPLRVLQELEQGERCEPERDERIHIARCADMREECGEPQMRAEIDTAHLTSE